MVKGGRVSPLYPINNKITGILTQLLFNDSPAVNQEGPDKITFSSGKEVK
jgi:hypothetical protein